jgi:hypothetical protein
MKRRIRVELDLPERLSADRDRVLAVVVEETLADPADNG